MLQNSVAAKVQSAAVPVNEVWEERRGDKNSYSSACRHELTFDGTCAHTHARMHRRTPKLTGPGLSPVKRSGCRWMFIHQQRHPSSAATNYCHPRIYTAELKGSPAWRLGEDSNGFLRVVNLRVNNLSSCSCFLWSCVLTQHAALSGPLWNTSRSNIFVSDRCASVHLHQPRESLPNYHKPYLIFIHSRDHLMLFKKIKNKAEITEKCKYMDRAQFKM